MRTWPATTTHVAMAVQSCTNVAPVRYDRANGSGQRMIDPVTTMTGIIPSTNAELAFWPALNLPTSPVASRPRDTSQRRSATVQRARRRTSARTLSRHLPA